VRERRRGGVFRRKLTRETGSATIQNSCISKNKHDTATQKVLSGDNSGQIWMGTEEITSKLELLSIGRQSSEDDV
jgi:hypothetical protein